MSWRSIQARFRELLTARDRNAPFGEAWEAYRSEVQAAATRPPYHLRRLLRTVEDAARRHPTGQPVVLDHGCGGGSTSLFLFALGYREIYGVDITEGCTGWNRLLAEELGIDTPRFFTYDGQRLPLASESVDVVFSKQVLEHVRPEAIDAYYAEEARVLKPGGIAFHEVPHRLVPYDSHTETWFVHYLPRALALHLYRMLGCNMAFVRNELFLRSPGFHRAQVRRHIGEVRDVTIERLAGLGDLEYYDGPKRLRQAMTMLVNLPILGRMAALTLRNFVMLDTLARKDPTHADANHSDAGGT